MIKERGFQSMSKNWRTLAAIAIAACAQVNAQVSERRAALNGGPSGGPGKCTIEVIVDGSAEVEIRGDSALLRTLGGQPAQWRRFQCTNPMPVQPFGFRFSGVDGRGRQQLQTDPGRGGPAVIRIDDPQGGSEGYTFDITWNGAGQGGPPDRGIPDRDRDRDRDRPPLPPPGRDRDFDRDRDRDRDFDRPFQVNEAVRACERSASDQATSRFRPETVVIRESRVDDGPGRNDWVIGTLEIRRGRDIDTYRFSCSVDFRRRQIRSVNLDPVRGRR
jgi:hypothetical protein